MYSSNFPRSVNVFFPLDLAVSYPWPYNCIEKVEDIAATFLYAAMDTYRSEPWLQILNGFFIMVRSWRVPG
jgi:hypothetical protein